MSSAERAALSTVFISPRNLDTLRTAVSPRQFADPDARRVFEAMVALNEAGTPINSITLGAAVGSVSTVTSIEDEFGDPASIEAYADMIVAAHTLRQVKDLSVFIDGAHSMSPDMLLAEVEARVLSMRDGKSDKGILPASEWVPNALEHMEEDEPVRMETGLAGLDSMCSIGPGNVVILAARPGMGKTALACHLCSTHPARRVGFFSYEMSTMELAIRMYAARAQVDGYRIRDRRLSRNDWTKLIDAAKDMNQWGLHFDDDTASDWPALAAKIRRFCSEEPTALIVVDYLQLLSYPTYAGSGRAQEVGAISRGCKLLAKQTGVPILALSQLNREPEKGGAPRRPRLSDLKESGSIEQDADIVWMLHREIGEPPKNVPTPISLIVAKNRHGATGDVPLVWMPSTYRFSEPGG